MPAIVYRDRVLGALPATRREVELKTGVSKNSVWRWIEALHEEKAVHIGKWLRGRGKFVPVFYPGPGRDAPCQFKPLTIAQVSRRHREKARKSGEWDFRLARQRAKYHADKAKPDPLVAALFGPRIKPTQEKA